VECTPFVNQCQLGRKLSGSLAFGFNLAIYIGTMEKSEENKAKTRISSLETFDTRPVNGKSIESSRQMGSVVVGQDSLKGSGSLKRWFELVVYWARELLWRRRFWQYIRRDHD
jgi:hypothetical protein